MAQAATFNRLVGNDPFGTHAPKPDNIKAVKLTEGNKKDLAAYAIKVPGIEAVDTSVKGTLWIGNSTFTSGDWIVEEYDFDSERTLFRRATTYEREKYDLR